MLQFLHDVYTIAVTLIVLAAINHPVATLIAVSFLLAAVIIIESRPMLYTSRPSTVRRAHIARVHNAAVKLYQSPERIASDHAECERERMRKLQARSDVLTTCGYIAIVVCVCVLYLAWSY